MGEMGGGGGFQRVTPLTFSPGALLMKTSEAFWMQESGLWDLFWKLSHFMETLRLQYSMVEDF